MVGVLIGLVSGGLMAWLLSRFGASIAAGEFSGVAVAAGVLQLFVPLGALLVCAFVAREQLLPAGISMAAALCTGVAIYAFRLMRKPKKEEREHD